MVQGAGFFDQALLRLQLPPKLASRWQQACYRALAQLGDGHSLLRNTIMVVARA